MGSNPTPRTTVAPLAVVWNLKKLGRKDSTLVPILKRLKYLAKNVDLNQPEKVKQFIASKPCSDGYKDNLIDVYARYCKYARAARNFIFVCGSHARAGEKGPLYFSIILKNIRVKTFLSSGVDMSHISLSNSSSGVAGQTFSDRKFAKASDIC